MIKRRASGQLESVFQYRLSHWTRPMLPLEDRATRNYPIRDPGAVPPTSVARWIRLKLRRYGRPQTR